MRYVFYINEQTLYRLEGDLPPSNEYVIFELDEDLPVDLLEVVFDGNTYSLRKIPPERLFERLKQEKLQQLRMLFASRISGTDYILIKIEEAKLLNQDIQPLLEKYATQLQERQQLRQRYEELKQAIQNATTLEELNAIDLTL